MIPQNIEKKHILKAIEEIERYGIQQGRKSRGFSLQYNGKDYPPKYVISLANKYANGEELDSEEFSGGDESNKFLKKRGFSIKDIEPKTFAEKRMKEAAITRARRTTHNQRCKKCKQTITKLLEKIYGKVEKSPKFEVGTLPEDYKDTPYYNKLKEIYQALQEHRGFKAFVKVRTLPRCDLYVPEPGFIFEYDESQHFTLPRKIALKHYPNDLKLGFDKERWMALCEKINEKDKTPPYREEQRTWYETIRDFLPAIRGFKPTVRVFMKDFQWCSLDPESLKDVIKFRELIENKQHKLYGWWVATVLIKSNERYSNEERLKVTSQVVDLVSNDTEGDGVILFPGGWFDTGKQEAKSLYKLAEASIKHITSKKKRNIIICLGIDGRLHRFPKDQIGIAISKKGIEAIGRKFHPIRDKKRFIEAAKSHLEKEENKSRTFELNGKKYFMCVCYDSFGIKHNSIPKMGVDAVLDLVHGFYPKGEGGSGTGNFARHGLAGASNQWKCPVFCATVFFRREIPETFPSGVYWDKGNTYSPKCTNEAIRVNPSRIENIKVKEGKVCVRVYDLEAI
jgi:hypothetical protein